VPRPPQDRPWYTSVFVLVPACGVLPFGSIFIEMYFMFSSFWNYKFYYVYGFLLLVFLILVSA
jgi:transmembrane 9 superfamily protein 3